VVLVLVLVLMRSVMLVLMRSVMLVQMQAIDGNHPATSETVV
jgi:hypothetical protein